MTEHDWECPPPGARGKPLVLRGSDVTAQRCARCGAWRGRVTGRLVPWLGPDARTCEEHQVLEVHES